MKRSQKITMTTLLALGVTLMFAHSAQAGGCGRGGGGFHGGGHRGGGFYGGGHFQASRHRHVPSYPAYQPSYSAPPTYRQPQPGTGGQFGGQFAGQPGGQFGGQMNGGQPIGGPGQAGQQQMTQPGAQQGNIAQQQQPQQTQQQTQQPQRTASGGNSAGGNTGNSSGSNANTNAESSALEALGGFAPPENSSESTTQSATESSPQQAAHVGTWTGSLENGARVQLDLQADGSFRWAATNKSGSTSSFDGTYTVGGGSLTLIRARDNQKLAGNMDQSGQNGFQFKVSGTSNAAAIDFKRS